MALEDGEAAQARTRRGRRITVLGLLALVAIVAGALVVYRNYLQRRIERPAIVADFMRTSPVADGVIGRAEYGTPVTLTWTEGSIIAAFEPTLRDFEKATVPGDPSSAPLMIDPTTSKSPSDLSLDVYAAFTDKSLFLAFHVHDQFVDAQVEEERPELDDGVELFIDGDGVPNDFVPNDDSVPGGVRGSKEGFQIGGNAAGQKFTKSQDFTNDDWKSVAKRTDDGYIVEMEIPLALMDMQDGPPFTPAGPGAMLSLGLAVTDNDAEVHKQMSYAYLKTAKQTLSPYLGGERAWNFGIKLEPRWSWLPW
jgi:hypothetical protein